MVPDFLSALGLHFCFKEFSESFEIETLITTPNLSQKKVEIGKKFRMQIKK